MDSGVPFALVASADLLEAGAFAGLAGSFLRRPLRGRGTAGVTASIPGVAGSLSVVASAALAGSSLGHPAGTAPLWLAAIGFALIAVALLGRPDPRALGVAPVGATIPPSVLAVVGGIVAAGAALRLRGPAGRVLGLALLICGGVFAFAPLARTHTAAAETLLSIRIAGCLLLLGVLAYLARTSLRTKVFTVVGLGVLATAIGTAGVVGTVVANQLAADRSGLMLTAAPVLRSQRTVLQLLFVALLVIMTLVALTAYVFGRRMLGPVRTLTGAARAVGRGDLTVRPAVTSADELGQLAQVFARMTGNLQTLTDDLRTTAETEAGTRERLRTILDATPDALVVSGPDGVVDLANPAAVTLLGPLVGRGVEDVLVGPDGVRLPDGEQVLATPDGPVPVEVARASLPGRRGVVHVLRDVTAARQLERAKTEFLSNVSHELRAPLTPIQGYADLLRRRDDLGPEQTRAMADAISEGARRMARVVDLLVDVAALDAGRVAPAAEPLEPAAVLDARLDHWRSRVPARAGDLRRRVSARLPAVMADPLWLGRALDELIDNALRHTPTGTPVTLLATGGAGDRVVLAVLDGGPGLDPGAQERLFDDFEQVDGSATRGHDGLGLGLAFVRRVAVVMAAEVSVDSRVGGGARFALDLPAASPAVPPAVQPAVERAGRAPDRAASVTSARATARAGGGKRR